MKASILATTLLLWGIDAAVSPAQAQPCASAVPLKPKGEVRYFSESGSATLIGFSEFTSPSAPPKKYRRQRTSGTVNVGFWNGDNCLTPTYATSYSDGGERIEVPGDPFFITWSAELTPISGGPDTPVTYRATTFGVHTNRAGVAEPFPVYIRVGGATAGNADDVDVPDGGIVALDPASGSAPFTVSAVSYSLYGGSLPSKSVLMCAPVLQQYRDVWDEVAEYDARDRAGTTFLPPTSASVRTAAASSTFPFTSSGTVSGTPRESDYAGGTRETLTAVSRELAGTDACIPFTGGRKRVQGSVTSQLSVEDTDDDAIGRAILTPGDSRTAYRTKRTNGFSFDFAKVRIDATFDITCPGEYAILVHYAKRPHDSSAAATLHMDPVETGYFPAGPKFFAFNVAVGANDPVFNQFDTDYTIEKIEARLVCPDLPPGGSSASLGSVRIQLGLGRTTGAFSGAQLLLEADEITSALYSPASLSLIFPTAGSDDVVRDSAGVLRQVKAPQALADIVALNATSYEVRFFTVAQLGARDPTTKIYAINGAPFVVYRFENPDAAGGAGGGNRQLRMTEERGTVTKTTEYAFDPAAGVWVFSQADGLRQESETIAGDSNGDTIKFLTVSAGTGQVGATIARVYRAFPWGEEMIRESRGAQLGRGGLIEPDGLAMTTRFDFYDDVPTSHPNYARLKQRTAFDGGWERFTYDPAGRVLTTTRPFLNTPATTSDDTQCRVTENRYDTIPDGDGDGTPEARTLTVERTQGQETARRYRIEWSRPVTFDGVACKRRVDIVSVVAGAAWDAAGGLTTETLVYDFGKFKAREARVSQPDGTAVLTTYRLDANGQLTTTVKSGQPNAARTDIIDGRRTVTLTNGAGQIVNEAVTDIASNLLLTSSTATAFDALGRPTRTEYSDGTFVLRTYACCGLASERDRTGLVTTYKYDPLGRRIEVTRDGIVTRTIYDAEGRVTATIRVGSDGSEMTRETSTYDLAGSLLTQSDALGRATTHVWSYDPNAGQLTRTTTDPDGGVSLAIYANDGLPLSVGGGTIAPRVYAYGIDTDGTFVRDTAVGSDATGQATTTEWTETITDFAGRVSRVRFADGATARSFFNAAGQRVRQVDPDGVTQLFSYNARGEQEISAVDLNGNGSIDLAIDRVVRTTSAVAMKTTASGAVPVNRSTTEVWETDNDNTPTVVAISEQSSDGARSWQTVRGLTTATVSISDGAGGRTITTTTPDGVQSIQTYSGDRLTAHTVKTAAGTQLSASTYTYDGHGRMLSSTDARNGATTYVYHGDDQIRSVTTPDPDPMRAGPGYDPQTTHYAYDNAGRLKTVTLPDGATVNTTYWPTGQPRRVWGARTYPVEYTYDPQGRLLTLTTWRDFAGDSGRAVTSWSYDPLRGLLRNKRQADNTGPTYTYLPSGRLRSRTGSRSPAITATYSYNAAGDLVATDYSDDTPDVTISPDRTGRPKTIADASGVRVVGYHTSGQIQSETYSTGLLAGHSVSRTFDALQRLGTLSFPAGTSVSYSYDAASRLQTVTSGTTTATYAYAANSAFVESVTLTSAGTPRVVTTRSYDHLDRITAITNTLAGAPAATHAYTYNAADQRTRVIRENGRAWSYTYDPLGQVTGAKKLLPDNVVALGRDYAWTFDDIGNRKTAVANGASSTYVTNALNQYSQRSTPGVIDVVGAAGAAATVTVAVDGGAPQPTTRQGEFFHQQVVVDNTAGGRTVPLKIYGVANLAGPNGQDAVTEVATTAFVAGAQESFSHDADGNLTADARWRYTWDGENRLIGIETTASAAAAGAARLKLAFTYDAQGRRVAKQVFRGENSSWTLASHTRFVYDGWNMIAELDALGGNAPIRTYTWGLDVSGSRQAAGGVGGLLGITDAAANATHFATYDGNGNVSGLVAASDGKTSATYDYNPFGEPALSEGGYARSNPFRFSTKYTDAETGHLYYGYRYYAPELGRWLSRDPIEEEGGVNLYGFVANDPISNVDVLGLAGYFFDGTGNNAKSGTNVIILHDLYAGLRYYYQGVGSSFGTRLVGGLTGAGRHNRLNAAYRDFIRAVDAGDRYVDIIGFSRGGSLAREFANLLNERGYDPAYGGNVKHKLRAAGTNKTPGECEFVIRFVGLFDSVGSFGVPGNYIDIGIRMNLPGTVGNAAQAIAQNERRFLFPLTRLGNREGFDEQGFPGDHSDIGRGHGKDTNDLSRAPLEYIWNQGRSAGVPFGALPDYTPTGNTTPHDLSRKFPYNLFPKRPR